MSYAYRCGQALVEKNASHNRAISVSMCMHEVCVGVGGQGMRVG